MMRRAIISLYMVLLLLPSSLAFVTRSHPNIPRSTESPAERNTLLQRRIKTTHGCRGANDALVLNSVLGNFLQTADTLWRTQPYLAAAFTCGFKASAADYVAQRRQYKDLEQKTNTDIRRNVAYIFYGALYQGVTQEYVYNHLYPVFFGSGTDVVTVLTKVFFDLLVQTTLLTLPIAYFSKALIYRYGFREALRRYTDDIRNHGLLTKYFGLWGPVQCLTFSVVPEHWRVTFIAMVSFFWLIILSTIASKTPILPVDEDCLLEDGQTCRIEG